MRRKYPKQFMKVYPPEEKPLEIPRAKVEIIGQKRRMLETERVGNGLLVWLIPGWAVSNYSEPLISNPHRTGH